ncbi:MAG: RdgB/HAM1 family non-canonical purine NTP pyrophosphatase [Caldisericia bacterium]|nr:RdgB/HAM1 family non-canonical purine NTP pyrophosphatase [Caldisericia bacterium]
MKKNFSKTLLVATENPHKLREYIGVSKLFDLKIKFLSLRDFNGLSLPEETGETFLENALIKARYAFEKTKIPTIADDSGLIIDYLDGKPGVFSKRFAGEDGDFEKNIKKVLLLLEGVPFEKRKAMFKTVIVYKDSEREKAFEGTLSGYIWFEKRGKEGFGYDPIFYLPELDKTIGELSFEEKNKISHRSKALRKLFAYLSNQSYNPVDP